MEITIDIITISKKFIVKIIGYNNYNQLLGKLIIKRLFK